MDHRTSAQKTWAPNPYLALFVGGLAAAAWETALTRALPPLFASPALAGPAVSIVGLVAVLCGSLYVLRRGDRIADRAGALAVFQIVAGATAVAAFHVLAGTGGSLAMLSGGFHGAAPASAIGLALVLAVILVPGFLLGALLAIGLGPLPSPRPGGGLSSSLAAVLFGLAAGKAVSAFVLLDVLGARGTLLSAAGAMVAAGAVSMAARPVKADGGLDAAGAGSARAPVAGAAAAATGGGDGAVALLWSMLLVTSGAVAAVAWTRMCQLAAGATPHTGAAAITVWLACAGLGLAITGRFRAGLADRPHLAGLIATLAGTLWLVPVYFANDLPFLFLKTAGRGAASGNLAGGYWALALAVFLVPGVALGAGLAATLALWRPSWTPGPRQPSAGLSAVLAGALAAVVLAPVVPSRAIDLRTAAVAAPWLAIAVGVWPALARPRRLRPAIITCLVAAIAAVVTAFAPSWNQGILTAGVYARHDRGGDLRELRSVLEGADVPYLRADGGRIVSVHRSPDGVALRENGRPVASTGADLPAQMLAAHLPLAICREPRRVLVLGLATGITIGSAESHPVDRIDCVEPLVAAVAASRHFAPYNHQALTDPRVNLIICDPASYLLVADEHYDVIVSHQVIPGWPASLARERISQSGIFCQQLSLDDLSEDAVRLLARDAATHFPYVGLWWVGGSRLVMMASMVPLEVESDTLRERLARPEVQRDLARLGTISDVGMLSLFVTGRDGLLSWASGAPDYSVDRAFAALDPSARPGALDGPAALARLERFREDPVALLADVEADDLASTIIGGQVGRCTSARSAYIRSLTAARSGRFGEASAYIEEARGNCPENGLLTLEASDFYVSASRSFASGRQLAEAIEAARRALELRPENPRGFYNLATLEMKRDPLTAAALLARAADLDPAYLPALLLQAEAEIEAGRLGPASETISRALSLAPFNLRAHHLRGICSLRAGQLAEARADFQRVVASEPQNAAALSALAYTWLLDGDLEKAQRSYEKALAVSPGDLEVLNNLATVLAERKDYGEAARIWEKALELNPSNQAIRANLEEVRQMMSRPEEGP